MTESSCAPSPANSNTLATKAVAPLRRQARPRSTARAASTQAMTESNPNDR